MKKKSSIWKTKSWIWKKNREYEKEILNMWNKILEYYTNTKCVGGTAEPIAKRQYLLHNFGILLRWRSR